MWKKRDRNNSLSKGRASPSTQNFNTSCFSMARGQHVCNCSRSSTLEGTMLGQHTIRLTESHLCDWRAFQKWLIRCLCRTATWCDCRFLSLKMSISSSDTVWGVHLYSQAQTSTSNFRNKAVRTQTYCVPTQWYIWVRFTAGQPLSARPAFFWFTAQLLLCNGRGRWLEKQQVDGPLRHIKQLQAVVSFCTVVCKIICLPLINFSKQSEADVTRDIRAGCVCLSTQ